MSCLDAWFVFIFSRSFRTWTLPSLHGVHLPQDSCLKNCDMFNAKSKMFLDLLTKINEHEPNDASSLQMFSLFIIRFGL